MSDETAFEQLVIDQLRTLASGHKLLADGLEEVKGEVVAVGFTAQQTLAQATQTNGKVADHENRLREFEQSRRDAENIQKGRKEQQADYIERVRTFRDFWPIVVGAVLGGLGTGSFIWSIVT